jgi:hypothetical protein
MDAQTIVEILLLLGTIAGVYVKLSDRQTRTETEVEHLQQALESEKEARKHEMERLSAETREDRKVFQKHAKETSDALHELGQAVHGLTVFLKGTIEDTPKQNRKRRPVEADV